MKVQGVEASLEATPDRVRDLAEGCVRFVERALGVRLDYAPDTLSILDHYLEEGRKSAAERPEAAALLAHAAGAYFGEVVRRRYPSWWRLDAMTRHSGGSSLSPSTSRSARSS